MADRRISKRCDTTKAHRHVCTERKHERKAGEKEVGRRRKETASGKDYQMIRWRSCGQDLKHLDKGKKGKRWNILCMFYTEV